MEANTFQFSFYLASGFPLDRVRVKHFAQKVDWPRWVDQLVFHRLAALTYYQICENKLKDLFPGFVTKALAESYAYNLISFERQAKCLGEVFKELNRQKIKAVLFRGLDLSVHAYGDPSLRDIGDIDIMANSETTPAIRTLLQRNGWKADRVAANNFSRDNQTIDLHLDPFNLSRHFFRKYTFAYQSEIISAEIIEGKLRGQRVYRYSKEAQFVLLAWHAQKHSYERLNWLVDMAFLVRSSKGQFDFVRMDFLAGALRLQKATHIALAFIQTYFAQTIPAQFFAAKRNPLGLIENYLLRRLMCGNFPAGGGVLLSALNTTNPLRAALFLAECIVSVDEIPMLFSAAGLKAYGKLLAKRFRQMRSFSL